MPGGAKWHRNVGPMRVAARRWASILENMLPITGAALHSFKCRGGCWRQTCDAVNRHIPHIAEMGDGARHQRDENALMGGSSLVAAAAAVRANRGACRPGATIILTRRADRILGRYAESSRDKYRHHKIIRVASGLANAEPPPCLENGVTGGAFWPWQLIPARYR